MMGKLSSYDVATPTADDYIPFIDSTTGDNKKALASNISAISATPGGGQSLLVASTTSPAAVLARADYICDGVADNVQIQAAIDAVIAAGGGKVWLSTGQFNTSSSINITSSNVNLEGVGRTATTILSTSGTHNLFAFTAGVKYLSIKSMKVSVHSTGGHIFAPAGTISHVYISDLHGSQANPAKSIWKQPDAGYYYNSWRECYFYHDGVTTAPMFDFTSSTSENHNSNTWERITTENVNTATAYIWDFATTISSDYLYANYFRDITCEIPVGGIARIKTCQGFVFENIEAWDIAAASTNNDLFYVGAGGGGLRSRKITFRNIGRFGGNLGSGLNDIKLESGKVDDVVFEMLQTANFSGFTVDLGLNSNVTIVSCPGVTFSNQRGMSVLPQLRIRTADSSAVNNNTLVDDDSLFWSVGTNETWFFEAYILVSAANATMDAKFGFTVPAGTSMQWGYLGQVTAGGWTIDGTTATPLTLRSAAQTQNLATVNGTIGVSIAGFVSSGSTSGEVYLSWAQNTTDAGDLKLLKGSFLRVNRLIK